MPGRSFIGKKYKRKFRSYKELLETSDYVDAGEIEVVAALRDIPENRHQMFESSERKFACLPWRLQMHKEVMHYQPGQEPQNDGILGNAQQNKPITFIRVALYCGFNEEGTWTVKASGVLTMEKWPEKVKSKDKDQQGEVAQKSGPKEIFTRKFNADGRKHNFLKRFPVSNNAAYVKNGQIKFRLELVVHCVRKVQFPIYDFSKKTPMCNAIAKVTDNEGQVHRFHVNKEYLSMHSETLARMFDNPGFVEGATGEVEFKSVSRETFQEFLSSIYPSRYRPQVKHIRELLEFARTWFIPVVTAVCEQRLLETEEKEMAIGERLKLADQYGLLRVKSQIMQRLEMESLDDKYTEGLSTETLQMLLRKQKRQKEQHGGGGGGNKAKQGHKGGDERMEVDQPSSSNRRSGGSSGRRGGGGSGHRH